MTKESRSRVLEFVCLVYVQVHASAESLRLITFDADGTLYADGAHLQQDNQMIHHIIMLMRSNVQVRNWHPMIGLGRVS